MNKNEKIGIEKRVTQELFVVVLERLSLVVALLQHAPANQLVLDVPRRLQLLLCHRIQTHRLLSTMARRKSDPNRKVAVQFQSRCAITIDHIDHIVNLNHN